MSSFKKIESTCVPLKIENVDTDQIVPARFLKATSREGFGKNLFYDWRYDKNNQVIDTFVLNDKKYSGSILLTGKNFGCGSSREHAVWAIYDYGFKVVISSFFADIFKNNALNNFLLPIKVTEDILERLFAIVENNPEEIISVDLATQKLQVEKLDLYYKFEINTYKKMCLLNQYDDIDYLLKHIEDIEKYEKNSIITKFLG